MQPIHLSGLLVGPIARRVRAWNLEGKLSEDDLDYALTADARALVDHAEGFEDWASLEDVEGLVRLVAERTGGETGLVEWADELVASWQHDASISGLIDRGTPLVDEPGFVVSQVSELLLRDADWLYEGGRSTFNVRLRGMADASSALKALLGALLARVAMATQVREFDVRFDGVDGDEIVVFGESLSCDDPKEESRLHQAALVA